MKIHLGGQRGRVTIDGRDFEGRNITINGDKVVVDGEVQDGSLVGPVYVTVQGDAESVETTSGNVRVDGSCREVKSSSGDIICHDVAGDVRTMSGDVEVSGSIGGSASTMSGDVIQRGES